MAEDDRLRELVAEVAAAYFSNSHVTVSDIPSVIQQIATSLGGVGVAPLQSAEAAGEVEPEPAQKVTPAQIRRSITPDALISFEDGKPYKTLKRHLSTRGLTPDQYREKWGLPRDYPMVSPNYSATRSQMAKTLGLGQIRSAARKAARGGRRPKAVAPAATS